MTKTIETLEQEAKDARDLAAKEFANYVPNYPTVADRLIEASVAMMTYQLALAEKEQREAPLKALQELASQTQELGMDEVEKGEIKTFAEKRAIKYSNPYLFAKF